SALFPYTTLFRPGVRMGTVEHRPEQVRELTPRKRRLLAGAGACPGADSGLLFPPPGTQAAPTKGRQSCNPRRSEEHTSELQSRENVVSHLLLEKKKRS